MRLHRIAELSLLTLVAVLREQPHHAQCHFKLVRERGFGPWEALLYNIHRVDNSVSAVLCIHCRRGVVVLHVIAGIVASVDGLAQSSDGDPETRDVADAPSRAAWVVKPGDIITSTVRPIRRLSALIRNNQDGCVCSSGFAVLTPKTGVNGIEPEVLLTYLRLPVICEILDLYTTASMYPAIPVDSLLRIPIVVPEKAAQKQIVAKVQDAMAARQEGKRLLDKAKKSVEDMISGESGRTTK